MNEGTELNNPNPVLQANFISRTLYCWLNPLFSEGSRRTLQSDDVYTVLPEDSTAQLVQRVELEWNKELQLHKLRLQQHKDELLSSGEEGVMIKGEKKTTVAEEPSLGRALKRAFRKIWLFWFIVAIFEEVVKVTQAVLLGGLIRYFSRDTTVTTLHAYIYACVIGSLSIALAVVHHPYAFAMFRLGIWIRTACSGLIYKKCLRLSNHALTKTTVGQIINLLSNDVQKFDLCMVFAHYLILGPLEVIAVFIILWFMISWSAVSGMSLLVLILPILAMLSRCFAHFRSKTAVFTDERVRLVNEMLNAMRLVKLYCWEPLFSDTISAARREEVKRITKANIARSVAFGPFFYSGKMIIYASLLTYVLMGYKLTAELVFVTISLYNVVRLTMTFFVPFGIQFASESKVTIQRVQAFLLLDERPESGPLSIAAADLAVSADKPAAIPAAADPSLSLVNMTAAWDSREMNGNVSAEAVSEAVLRNVSVTVKLSQLLAVIGPVGSGKTSLLMSVLGELPIRDGKIAVRGRVAYVSQQAWVFSASVRQNIVFNSQFDPDRYQTAIQAAALKKDLELMPEGDRTLVGERGVSLSGGQKARISLARALYSDADIYLLDDPLSAVDTQVSKHIFNKCICGVLKKKPRILVTHQLQYLRAADQILVLSKNEAPRVGTYDELCRTGVNIEQLIDEIHREQEEHGRVVKSPAVSGLTSAPRSPAISNHSSSTPKHMEVNHTEREKEGLTESPSVRRGLKYDEEVREIEGEREGLMNKQSDMRSAISNTSITTFTSDVLFDDAAEFRPEVQEEEGRVGGSVGASLYLKYLYMGTGVIGLVLCALLNLLSQSAYILVDWWLANWCNEIEAFEDQLHSNSSDWLMNATTQSPELQGTSISTLLSQIFPHNTRYLWIFTGLTAAVVIFGQLRATHTFFMLVRSANMLHKSMLAALLRCPIAFFDSNPIGRILNRFTKDMGQVDEILPLFMYDLMQSTLLVLAVVLVVGIVNPWVFIPTVPLCAVFIYLRSYYLKTARTLKRLEATSKSPVFSHVSASVLGLHTVRAYKAERVFIEEYSRHQDKNTAALYLFLITSRWFAVRLELICAVFITAVSVASVLAASSLNSGLVGLSMNYAITMMALFQWAVRQSSEVESSMTSVERIVEYSNLSPEAEWSTGQTKELRQWPSKGSISAKDLCLRYSPDGALVLKHLTFNIEAGEKVGIVGRTGAGKSSLISVLFRLIEPSGQLVIDNIDVQSIGLHDLRNKISIIPQDPELFSATVRRNLDPLGNKSDLQIWYALQQVQLKQMVEEMGRGLDSEIHEGGSNISMGERQLFCLARAILKSNRIMIIDEATANVDPVTDGLIQRTIRDQFRDCTVLTIAHRLNTIVDCDRIMVMDEGCIKEFDTPHTLLEDSSSLFYSMAKHLGDEQLLQLRAAASAAARDKHEQ